MKRLTAVCPVDVSKSEKLQDVEWVGKVLNAARSGDAAAIKELLQHKKAKQRIRKLRKPLPEVRPFVLQCPAVIRICMPASHVLQHDINRVLAGATCRSSAKHHWLI